VTLNNKFFLLKLKSRVLLPFWASFVHFYFPLSLDFDLISCLMTRSLGAFRSLVREQTTITTELELIASGGVPFPLTSPSHSYSGFHEQNYTESSAFADVQHHQPNYNGETNHFHDHNHPVSLRISRRILNSGYSELRRVWGGGQICQLSRNTDVSYSRFVQARRFFF